MLTKKKSFKYLIGYNYNDEIKTLFIRLPQITGSAKFFDNAKSMPFKVNESYKVILKSYIKIWEKVSSLINMKFDSERYYGNDNKYMKAKIKMIKNKLCTKFYGKGMQKNTGYMCLPLTILDYVSKINKKYYPLTFLKECKCKIKNNKMECNINFDFDTSSSDECDNEPGSESDNESDNNESGNN